MSLPFFDVCHLSSTDSTNSVAVTAAEAGRPEGYVVCAAQQTGGRGRLGRTWESPEGNLYASILLRPRCSMQEACYYSFVAAMAVYDAIALVRGDTDLQLKWPNDVLIDGQKISGILIETAPVQEGVIDWLVMGVGINVSSSPDNTPYPTTNLAKEGADVSVASLLEAFLGALERWHSTLKHDGFGPVRRAWLADAKRGEVSVKLPSETLAGQFAGLDPTGGLILRLADGSERVIQAGDVFYS